MKSKIVIVLKKSFLFITLLFWSLIICSADSLLEPIIQILNEDGSVYWQLMYYWVPLVGLIIDYFIFRFFYTAKDFE